MDNRTIKIMIDKYLRFGDRKLASAQSIRKEIDDLQNKIKYMDKGDARENYDYVDAKDKLSSLAYKSTQFTHWASKYTSFKDTLINYESSVRNENIDVGSVVVVETKGKEYTLLMVPNHLGNRTIGARDIMSDIGQQLLGKKAGDTAQVHKHKTIIVYKIKEVY